ncbi:MAG: hypothetical protein A3J97_16645 [Spirochaetes bacterium RIFOXYC1_FULL_54_7]|nr:MAG: hypothetical protein A3J97_16645 [Spirochaetes bacterium RIFOXYC1_FULL_54_7]
MKRLIIFFLLGCCAFSLLGALEIKEGRMRIVIDERSGRMAFYYLTDMTKNQYVPLLYDQESRTSYPTLVLDQRTYKLGESGDFRITVSSQADGAMIEYRSAFCIVRQRISFVSSTTSSLSDGVSMRFDIENVSEKDYSAGLRYLLDTWLGEKSGRHFTSPVTGTLQGESFLTGEFPERWMLSTGDNAAVSVLLDNPSTRPDRILFANWKRINDAPWLFDVNTTRGFTLLPYSINDSALALYYEPIPVRRGATRSITVVFGNESVSSLTNRVADTASQAASTFAALSESAPLDLRADLITVRDFIRAINTLLESGEEPAQDELDSLKAVLQRLETRKSSY